MKHKHKEYILENINKKSIEQIARDLGLKERKIRQYLKGVKTETAKTEEKGEVMPGQPKVKSAFILFLIAVLTVGIYFNSLKGGFVFDDKPMIVQYDFIKDIRNIPKAFISSTNIFGNTNYYRPLQTVSYMVDYFLWADDPLGFHMTNVMFHILAVMAIYFFIILLFGNKIYAALTALFFSVHPVHTAAVSYIAGRADSMLCLFAVLSLHCYIKFKYLKTGKGCFALSVLFFIFALLTKESALIVPLVILLFDIFLFRWTVLKKGIPEPLYYTPFAVTLAAYLLFRVKYMSFYTPGTVEPFPFFSRIITAPYIMMQYVRLIFFPNDLHIERLAWVGSSFFNVRIFLSTALLVILLLVVYKAQKNSKPVFFGFLWFLIWIFPSLNIVTPLLSTLADNWLYIPSIGLFLILAFRIAQLYDITRKKNIFLSFSVILITLLYVASMAAITVTHNKNWASEIAVCENTIRFNPLAFKVYNNLGVAYAEMGKMDKAEESFLKCLEIKPDTGMAYYNLYKIYAGRGDMDKANECLNKAKELDPYEVNVLIEKKYRK